MTVQLSLSYVDARDALSLRITGLPDNECADVVVEGYRWMTPGQLASAMVTKAREALQDGTARGERRWEAASRASLWYPLFRTLPRLL